MALVDPVLTSSTDPNAPLPGPVRVPPGDVDLVARLTACTDLDELVDAGLTAGLSVYVAPGHSADGSAGWTVDAYRRAQPSIVRLGCDDRGRLAPAPAGP